MLPLVEGPFTSGDDAHLLRWQITHWWKILLSVESQCMRIS